MSEIYLKEDLPIECIKQEDESLYIKYCLSESLSFSALTSSSNEPVYRADCADPEEYACHI